MNIQSRKRLLIFLTGIILLFLSFVFSRYGELEEAVIIKDESESARLAGFGISNPTVQQVFLHKDEIEIGEKILQHLF